MDEDQNSDLIAQLCTQVGMIMEDASIVALTVGSTAEPKRTMDIKDLDTAIRRMSALINATRALSG
ncbi:MAG: hypothetical protein ACTHLU_11785 [Novosphingobium sp.]